MSLPMCSVQLGLQWLSVLNMQTFFPCHSLNNINTYIMYIILGITIQRLFNIRCVQITCKYYATLGKGLEHPWILVSTGGFWNQFPQILRDGCQFRVLRLCSQVKLARNFPFTYYHLVLGTCWSHKMSQGVPFFFYSLQRLTFAITYFLNIGQYSPKKLFCLEFSFQEY